MNNEQNIDITDTASISEQPPKTEQPTLREQWKAHMTEELRDAQRAEMLAELLPTLPLLFDACDGRVAVRAKSMLGYSVLNGVYDANHMVKLATDMVNKSTSGAYIWWATMNALTDDVKTTNELDWGFGISTKEIARVVWFVVDFDPLRPAGTETTDEGREAMNAL